MSLTVPIPAPDARTVILGRSGTGKSVLFRHLVKGMAAQGRRVLVVDWEGEHEGLGHPWNHRIPILNIRAWQHHPVLVWARPDETQAREVREWLDGTIHALWPVENLTFAIDEAHHTWPNDVTAARTFPSLTELFTGGRKRKMSGLWASQMFTEMSKPLLKQSNSVYVMDGLLPGEQEYLRSLKFEVEGLRTGDENVSYEFVEVGSGRRYAKVPE